ncbi:MAG: DUF1129 family protein [Streptococcaceae bacterium]|jgi:uncharacterized membrane-anchored protein|nr:DUF1129 family protein [Streptococcaceae bacterium]
MENYIEQLTAKNSEYIHSITRDLVKIGKTDDEIKAILSEILPQIIDAQGQRILAKDLLGTPSEFTAKHTPQTTTAKSGKKTATENDNETPVLMWLDSSLLMLGFLALVNGMVAVFSKNARTYGIVTLIAMSFAAGFFLYLMYRLIYKPQNEGKKTGFKSFGLLALAFLGWLTVFTLTMLLPTSINISPAGYIVAAIGLLSLGGRYLLKRKFHIKSALATPTPRN